MRIEEAAALITARARENAPSGYTSNAPPTASPDRNMMRAQHRRMQNLQTSSVGRLSDSLERRSPEKGLRSSKLSDFEDFRSSRSSDRSPAKPRSETPTPVGRSTPKSKEPETTPPSLSKLALQTIRNKQDAPVPLGDVTNGSSSLTPLSYPFDALSSQILSLTNMVTSLQREMASLNKRSKDHASEPMDLKDGTADRDDDIRKSLRDLVSELENKLSHLDARLLSAPDAARQMPNLGLYLDEKAHNSSPRPKSFTLPRIPSPSSFSGALDRDLSASPSIACVDGAASIALLEKVLREMATRDGQEKIMATLEAVKCQAQAVGPSPSAIDPAMMAKLEDILVFMKDMKEESGTKALIKAGSSSTGKAPSHIDRYLEAESGSGSLAKAKPGRESLSSTSAGVGSDFVNDEIMKMLKTVKQSLSQGGGLTNEVKALVRELRGEVLGMGREIARKLEQAESATKAAAHPDDHGLAREEVEQIVDQGLVELKEHMHHLIQENRRQSANRSGMDPQEVIHAVRSALVEMPRPREEPRRDPVAEREELLAAVKEAWEDCKPEIALEHFGLERDEILETLKEGLRSYQPQRPTVRDAGATYEEVVEAVQKGLANFRPPPIQAEAVAAALSREEVLATVRECLENFEWPTPPPPPVTASETRSLDLKREDVLDVVREGLSQHVPVAKEIEFNREDLFDAIKACLEGEQNPLGGMGERVIEAMHEFLSSMKTEFKQYSAASGKDTEQVLDALKDGLEDLRADIESYVDRAADVTGKDEIIDTVKAGFAAMQADIDKGFASHAGQGAPNTPELLDAMEKEFQHLRETIGKSMAPSNLSSDKDEILDAIRDVADDRQSALSSNSEDIVRLVKEELEHMRTTLAGTLVKSGGSSLDRDEVLDAIREGLETHRSVPRADGNDSILSNTSELLDAFQDGVDGIRADIQKLTDRPVDMSTGYDILETLKRGIEDIRVDISRLPDRPNDMSDTGTARGQEVVVHDQHRISTEIEGLKVMITQLRIKIEALDGISQTAAPNGGESRMHKDDMDEIFGAITQVQESVHEMKEGGSRVHKDDIDGLYNAIAQVNDAVSRVRTAPPPAVVMPENAASKEDTDAIETLLRNVKARLDDMVMPDMDGAAKASDLREVEDMLRGIKTAMEESSQQAGGKDDLTLIELLLKDVQASVGDLQEKVGSIGGEDGLLSKNELQVMESLCLEVKDKLDGFSFPEAENIPTKDDIGEVKSDIRAFREQLEADNELTAQAFEARKIEHGGLANKIDDVKNVIGDLRDELVGKLDGSEEGIVELSKVLGLHHDNMSKYATAASLTELSDLVKGELDRHMDHHTSSKAEMEERDATLFTKHEETSAELRNVIDEKFTELMTKYDDAQLSSEAKIQTLNERDAAHFEATSGTKALLDDLKLLMDTLGSSVTETCERLSEDSKTVFARVDHATTKLGELHTSNAFEHGLTREEVAKTLAATARLEGVVSDNQPAILAAVREVLGIVGQHYEHSQQQTENFARATEEIKSGVNSIPASIPPLLPALPPAPASPPLVREVPVQREYDDSRVHDKLDNLISHAAMVKEAFASLENHQQNTQESLANMEKLDRIHEQVMSTAAEISGMVSTQARLMTEHHESKATEATEAAIALEKRTAQKERVEADIVALTAEKDALAQSMAALKKEHDELNSQTKRLTREVAKLEAALHVRQDEMREMNARAESLERRILEGLVNHARSVKASRPLGTRKITPAERDAAMNLKRVPSSASTVTARTSIKDGNSTIGSAVGMALKKRTALGLSRAHSAASSRSSGVDRRILSTSHVTGNRGRNAPETALVLAPAPKTGLVSLKRSQSVRTNPTSLLNGRKSSWTDVGSTHADKENHGHDYHDDDRNDSDDSSDAGTERRTSLEGTSIMYTDSVMYGTGSTISSRSRRSTSYASSIVGTINGHAESITEEDEEHENEEEGEEEEPSSTTLALLEGLPSAGNMDKENSMALAPYDGLGSPAHGDGLSELRPPPLITDIGIKYHQGSDSGLGTEPGTSDGERVGEAQKYFDKTRRELRT